MNIKKQQNLFPVMGNLLEVQQAAISKLPITDPNELIAILRLQQNTLLNQLAKLDESIQTNPSKISPTTH